MTNETLITAGKNILKGLLSECTEGQQMMFKRMYSHKNLDRSIEDAVDNIDPEKIDHAITQCENTIRKNKLNNVTNNN